jgi:hypothetical protein
VKNDIPYQVKEFVDYIVVYLGIFGSIEFDITLSEKDNKAGRVLTVKGSSDRAFDVTPNFAFEGEFVKEILLPDSADLSKKPEVQENNGIYEIKVSIRPLEAPITSGKLSFKKQRIFTSSSN